MALRSPERQLRFDQLSRRYAHRLRLAPPWRVRQTLIPAVLRMSAALPSARSPCRCGRASGQQL